jgi:hypothetical protein
MQHLDYCSSLKSSWPEENKISWVLFFYLNPEVESHIPISLLLLEIDDTFPSLVEELECVYYFMFLLSSDFSSMGTSILGSKKSTMSKKDVVIGKRSCCVWILGCGDCMPWLM